MNIISAIHQIISITTLDAMQRKHDEKLSEAKRFIITLDTACKCKGQYNNIQQCNNIQFCNTKHNARVDEEVVVDSYISRSLQESFYSLVD